jgi:hypothetical protein
VAICVREGTAVEGSRPVQRTHGCMRGPPNTPVDARAAAVRAAVCAALRCASTPPRAQRPAPWRRRARGTRPRAPWAPRGRPRPPQHLARVSGCAGAGGQRRVHPLLCASPEASRPLHAAVTATQGGAAGGQCGPQQVRAVVLVRCANVGSLPAPTLLRSGGGGRRRRRRCQCADGCVGGRGGGRQRLQAGVDAGQQRHGALHVKTALRPIKNCIS